MRITLLASIPLQLLIIYFLGSIIGLAIFYYLIKAAVKNGIKESRLEKIEPRLLPKTEKAPTTESERLKQQYDKGQITFEEYKKEWAKL